MARRALCWLAPLRDKTTLDNAASIWAWAEREVVFPDSYPTDFKGPYSAALLPMLKEPVEMITRPEVRGVVVAKPSQAGGSEGIALNAVRFYFHEQPEHVLYVGGQKESTKHFLEERIIPSLKTTVPRFRDRWRGVEVKGDKVVSHNSSVTVTWSTSKDGLKSRSLRVVIGDEGDGWPKDALERLKKRLIARKLGTFVFFSALDPTRKDKKHPILTEYKQGSRAEWMMKDPRTGNLFTFRQGREGEKRTVDGLKWDPAARRDDGSWDLAMVERTAHYVTPDGTRIPDIERLQVVNAGEWVHADPSNPVKSYRYVGALLPWPSCSFGQLARGFLEAKAKGPAQLGVFIMETWVEEWWEEKRELSDDVFTRCAPAVCPEYVRPERWTTLPPFCDEVSGRV